MTSVQGQAGPTCASSEFNALSFLFSQMMGGNATATLVQVKAVTNDGGVSPVGTVDVQPMVNQTDGAGNATPHGIISGIPYFRLQGGTNAVIIDPQVGDIGVAVFASEDISVVKVTKATANPGSFRTFDWADGLYIGGFLNGTPIQYIQFIEGGGIALKSTGKITLTDGAGSTIVMNGDNTGTGTFSAGFKVVGPLEVTGATRLDSTLAVSGAVTGQSSATFTGDVVGGGKSLESHDHNVLAVQPGTGTITTTPPL